MGLDALLLSRLQFALTIGFHYLFPPLTIGLGVILVFMEGMYVRTGDRHYEQAARFWTKIFAATFAMGVASGIVMEFQFGMNWSAYSRFVGDVFGSALAAEGIFAFFLESGFLAVMVFGWDRVSKRLHFFSTVMVALGSIFSAIWIVVANSWQQTPAGFHLVERDGVLRAEITDFWALVFNPSSTIRLAHVIVGALILGAFFAMSIAAWYALKGRHAPFVRRTFAASLVVGLLASLAAPITGHYHATVVAQHQPTKLAAFEGHFHTGEGGAPMYLFGFPDEEEQRVRAGIAVPGLLSFLVHGDFDATVPGLDRFPREDWPPVALPFYSFHIMVALGLLFILLTLLAAWYYRRGTLFSRRWLMWILVFAVAGPYAANQLGWIAAEVGRQPWIVWGLQRTSEGLSPAVRSSEVLASILLFSVIYLALFAIWIFVLNNKIQHGPDEPEGDVAPAREPELQIAG